MLSIDQKIGIQCQDGMPIMDFSHSHNTCIGKRHRRVSIFLKQLAQRTDMVIDLKRDAERAILEELKQGVLRPRVPREQVHRLREHRFTYEERRFEVLDALGDPNVVLLRPVEKSDERSRINDGGGHRGQSPRDAPDSKRGLEFRS